MESGANRESPLKSGESSLTSSTMPCCRPRLCITLIAMNLRFGGWELKSDDPYMSG
jgi:hypothetical protein